MTLFSKPVTAKAKVAARVKQAQFLTCRCFFVLANTASIVTTITNSRETKGLKRKRRWPPLKRKRRWPPLRKVLKNSLTSN